MDPTLHERLGAFICAESCKTKPTVFKWLLINITTSETENCLVYDVVDVIVVSLEELWEMCTQHFAHHFSTQDLDK